MKTTNPTPAHAHPGASLTQQQLLGIYATVYLVYGIVVLRLFTLPPAKGGPYRLYVLVGIGVLTASFAWFHLKPPRSRRAMLTMFVLQAALILMMSVAGPPYFFALLLFLPVISSLMLYFPGTPGLIGICAFACCGLGLRWLALARPHDDASHYLIYAGFFLIGSYINMFVQAKEAHRESQTLLGELQESHAQLQRHAAQIEELAVTQERNRLARELHDSVSQMLFSITFLTQSAMMRLERKPTEAQKPIQQIQSTAESALKEMRALIFQLRPPQDDADFVALLKEHVAELQHRHPLKPTLQLPDALTLPPGITHHLFRIIQEALHNVVKHTPTQEVALRITQTPTRLCVDIEDQGPGFDRAGLRGDASTSFGLGIMEERAALIGATLSFDVQSEGGTRVSLALPLRATKTQDNPQDDSADDADQSIDMR